ncbi:MAG: glutamine--fructose-6-phosphate transaminase (isomerizing) [Gemmatimonadetes bacterium]|nr:glutamine--fructose-6-phosphate transaminase (isomerizing) [Gemmatimonadota bacterium]
MCGIYGCLADEAAGRVLEGLRKLEYRGYDSAGLAALFPEHVGPVETERTTGYVSDLVSKANGRLDGASIAIGHTRWATHGGVTDTNAHPHSSNDGTITIVHNGIIENATDLLERVENMGFRVESETDSELIVHLLDNEMKTQPKGMTLLDAFESTISKLRGSWAIAVIITGMDGILIARNGAPLIVGRGHDCISISSDVQPFYGSCSEVAYLSDGDIFLVTRNGISEGSGRMVPEFETLEGVYEEANPGIFPHMMLKEIHDQPIALSNVLGGRISADGSRAELGGFALSPEQIRNLDKINLVACGTAYYATLIGVDYLRRYTNLTVEAFRSSEFPAREVCGPNTLTIGVSQSGETKDTLDALQEARLAGSHISSFCNVIGSTIARLTGNGAYLYAGPEYSVASTKSFTNMVAALLLLTLTISELPKSHRRKIVQELRSLPSKLSRQLVEEDGSIERAVDILEGATSAIFIGRGISAPLVLEGALKMMEIAYLPSLAYPGGELKHGPIALIEEGTPVIAVAPSDGSLSLMESSIRECQTRGAKIILITDHEGPITQFADVIIQTQADHGDCSPMLNVVPLQLLAYHLADRKALNIDRPRNLAKSVTVA